MLIRDERFIRILLACMLNSHEIQTNLENVDESIKSRTYEFTFNYDSNHDSSATLSLLFSVYIYL